MDNFYKNTSLVKNEPESREARIQLVTFELDDGIYGIDVMNVKEITGITNITSLPDAVDYVKGAINLRGTAFPVIDLRLRFGLKDKNYDSQTVILIIEHREELTGLIVDSVRDVVEITSGSQRKELGNELSISRFVSFTLNYNNEFILVLDVLKLLDRRD